MATPVQGWLRCCGWFDLYCSPVFSAPSQGLSLGTSSRINSDEKAEMDPVTRNGEARKLNFAAHLREGGELLQRAVIHSSPELATTHPAV